MTEDESEKLVRNTIEDKGFEVHNANIVFRANCPNIDLIVYGKEQAIYVQVKSSKNPAGKDCITIDGSPWTESQLYREGPIYNKRDGLKAKLVVLVDISASGNTQFYVVPPDELDRAARKKGQEFAYKPKKDGTKRSINFRKELPKEHLSTWLNAWNLLGEPCNKPSKDD